MRRDVFQAIADPNRRAIIGLLVNEKLTVNAIAEHFKLWWGPKDYTCPFCEMDLRVGGKYLNCMRSPKGRDYWSTGVFREILLMERLVFTDSFADEQGNVV